MQNRFLAVSLRTEGLQMYLEVDISDVLFVTWRRISLKVPCLLPTLLHRRNSCVPSSSSCSTQSSSLRCLPFLKPRVPRQTSVRVNALFPFDQAWNPSTVDAQSIAPQIFAVSIFPYIGTWTNLLRIHRSSFDSQICSVVLRHLRILSLAHARLHPQAFCTI